MKKTLIAIAFAAASIPMFAASQAQTPANPPAAGSATQSSPAVKTKKQTKKASKKTAPKKDTGAAAATPAK